MVADVWYELVDNPSSPKENQYVFYGLTAQECFHLLINDSSIPLG